MVDTLVTTYSWGACGTHWLARVLSAHPDVMVLHHPLRQEGKMTLSSSLQTLDFLLGQASWSTIGLAHGTSYRDHDQYERWAKSKKLRHVACILTRHPILRVRSASFMFDSMSKNARHPDEGTWFLSMCNQAANIVGEMASGLPIVPMENVRIKMPDVLMSVLPERMREEYESCYRQICTENVSRHAPHLATPLEAWQSWSEDQQLMYTNEIWGEPAQAYLQLGYEDVEPWRQV